MLNAKLLALAVVAAAGLASTQASAHRPAAVAVAVPGVAVTVGGVGVTVGTPVYVPPPPPPVVVYAPPPPVQTVVYRDPPRRQRVVYAPVSSCGHHGHVASYHDHRPQPRGNAWGHDRNGKGWKHGKHGKHGKGHHGRGNQQVRHR